MIMHRVTNQLHLTFYLFDTKNDHTCKTCVYRHSVQCGGRVIQYCWINKSNRTFNGLAKTKIYKSCGKWKDICVHKWEKGYRGMSNCVKCGRIDES